MNSGKLVIGTELETKSFDAQINELEKKLEIMTKTLETDATIPVKLQMNENEKSKLKNDIEKTKNQIISLNQKQLDLGNTSEETGNKTSEGFDKGVKSLKRFALSIFSIRSAYALVSKASSAYLSQDTQLAEKLQSVWVGLGSIIAPAIDYISNALLKGLGYLNAFIKALTGVDLIAKANAKSLDKQAQAQNKLNKQTFDFDEIRKFEDNSNSESTSGLIEIPELDDRLVKKLQDLAYWLKENWDWISKVGIALGVTFGAIKIAGLLSNIGSLIGSATLATGLTGLASLLAIIGTVYLVTIAVQGVLEAKRKIDELNDSLDKNIEQTKTLNEQEENLAQGFKDAYEANKLSKEQIDKYKTSLDWTTESIVNHIGRLEEQKNWLGQITGSNEKLLEQQRLEAERLKTVTDEYDYLYNQKLLNIEQTSKYRDALEKQIGIMANLGEDTQELEDRYRSLNGIDPSITVTAYLKDNVTGELEKIIGRFSSAFGIGGGFLSGGGFSGGGGGSTGHFAQGGIVTQPTKALIGEAGYPEAVVPMTDSYLSTLASLISSYGGNNGSNVTNVYLNGRLIQRQVDEVSSNKNFATNS